MRILHIDTEPRWGGGQKQLALLLKGLARPEFETYLVINRRLVAGRLAAHGVRDALRLPVVNSLDLYSAGRIFLLAKSRHIDILHCHSGRAHALGLLVKTMMPSLKLVIHRRVAFERSRGMAGSAKYLSSRNDRFVAISSAVRASLLRLGVGEEKVVVIPSSVDPLELAACEMPATEAQAYAAKLRQDAGAARDSALILTASRLTGEKGIDLLLTACRLMKQRGLRFHCLVAGTGPDAPEFVRMQKELDLAAEVSFLGFRDDAYRLMNASDIYVLPSRSEGLGSSLLEALYFGCYLVGSDAGGIPEIIRSDALWLMPSRPRCSTGAQEQRSGQPGEVSSGRNIART
jgi:glycosyltransferase involved in cell wall biosynthesis